MFRQTARNIMSRRIVVTQCGAGPVQLRGMANKRVEDASQAAGEAKNSSPKVGSWHAVQEKLKFAETSKNHIGPTGCLTRRSDRQTVQSGRERWAGG